MHRPRRGVTCPAGGKKGRFCRKSESDQYSCGSSKVVTLRSHSVMIQSVKVGVI
jgi:hypothetical protein